MESSRYSFRVTSGLAERLPAAAFPSSADQDCACDCGVTPGHPSLAWPEVSLHTLYQPSHGLYAIPLALHSLGLAPSFSPADKYTLLFNPMGGLPSTLNDAACRLLAAFTPARSIGQVMTDHAPGWNPDDVRQAAEELVALSLLRPADEPVAASCHQPPPDTLAVWLHVSSQCNLRCDYCYLDKTDDMLTLDTGRRALDAVFRSATYHNFRRVKLKYAGGEPSLNAETLIQLHDYAADQAGRLNMGLDAVLLSNGVALSRRLIQALRERGIRVMISLDGVAADHDAQRKFPDGRGSFAAVAHTLECLQTMGMLPFVSVTVSARNLDGLPATAAYLLERDLPFGLSFYRDGAWPAEPPGLRFDDELVILAMQRVFDVIEANLPQRCLLGSLVDRASFVAPHKRTCGVGQNYLVIDAQGMVAKCQMAISRPVASVADEDPLASVQADQAGLQNLTADEKEGCRACAWRYWCAGGCPLATYRATGRYDVKSPNCRVYQALYPRLLRLEGLRLLRWVG